MVIKKITSVMLMAIFSRQNLVFNPAYVVDWMIEVTSKWQFSPHSCTNIKMIFAFF